MMYFECYGVCNIVVFSLVEILVYYGGVYVFHVYFDLCVVYGVGVCGVICVIECCLFLGPRCCYVV